MLIKHVFCLTTVRPETSKSRYLHHEGERLANRVWCFSCNVVHAFYQHKLYNAEGALLISQEQIWSLKACTLLGSPCSITNANVGIVESFQVVWSVPLAP